jgi:hypothetical protein
MSSFSAINLSRIAFPIAKRNLTIGLVVTCLAPGSLFASTPATSESGQTTNSQQVYSATLSHDDAHATLWMSDSAFFLDNQIHDLHSYGLSFKQSAMHHSNSFDTNATPY